MAGLFAWATLAPRPALAAEPEGALACRAPRAALGVDAQPAAWRAAVDALVRELGTPGKPWSCPGGSIDLAAHAEGATLVAVTADGRSISREVASPDEVVPLGEALFAQPMPAPPPPAAEPPAPPAPPPPAANEPANEPPPRALVSLTLGPRLGVPTKALWGSAALTAVLPFSGFTVGAFGRVDALATQLDGAPAPPLTTLAIGLTAGRAFDVGHDVELRASVAPALAVVTAKGPDETRIDGRIGVELRAARRLTSLFRGVLALDADLAPRELGAEPTKTQQRTDGDADHTHQDVPARFPAFTVGLGLGVEVTPR